MDNETLTALRGSIAKWQAIVDGRGVDDGSHNCPLCMKFVTPGRPASNCVGCPVAEHTNKTLCHGSPYEHFDGDELCINKRGGYAFRGALGKAALDAARAELEFLAELAFLAGLLPEGETA